MTTTLMVCALAGGFRSVTVDDKVGIGYGLAIADMDGDRKPDILLVDKQVVAWYRNPSWERTLIAEKLTRLDHVCIAARDLDGDGRAEVAAGAGWNPGDTVGSGSLHYLIAPAAGKGLWERADLPFEPTVHRIRWAAGREKSWNLVVAPLHGRGNKGGEGAGVKVLAYRKPADPKAGWATELLSDSLHVLHNLEVVNWDQDPEEEVLLAGREGVFHCDRGPEAWSSRKLAGARPGEAPFAGASEVRAGKLPGGRRFLVIVEPFHGSRVVAYAEPAGSPPDGLWERSEIDSTLNEGHALGCGDLLGKGSDQVVAGWRRKDKHGKVGIRIYAPRDRDGKSWERLVLDDDTMACEDLALADLDGDGRLDIVAAGRDTHNLKLYFKN